MTRELLSTCPSPDSPVDEVLEKAGAFLKNLARGTNRWDAYALEKFEEKILELVHWFRAGAEPCTLNPFD
ncbi:MAG: hypothetical protein JSV26_00545 [bacterium]|nr:MAG: hypothetical protein JSV26_00545 [bacterium]